MKKNHLRPVVENLCSDVCLPRNPGTPGGRAARDFLGDRLLELGIEPAGEEGYAQAIPPIDGTNLFARIPGRSERSVLLAAHYDACGANNPGADDNAAAVAIVLDVAERLVTRNLDRTVLIALFDAEEPPYFLGRTMGSQWFVDHPTVPLATIETMVCLDLVGHALGPDGLPDDVRDSVFVLGTEKSTGTGALFDALPATDGVVPRRIDNYVIPSMSDYDAFMTAGIPFLFYTAGRTEHYHAGTDTPGRLDYEKMAALATHLTDLIVGLANRPDTPRYLPGGFDDAATLASLGSLLGSVASDLPAAVAAQTLVASFEQQLVSIGVLSTADRRTISQLIVGIETSLA